MCLGPPKSTRNDTLFPSTTLFPSARPAPSSAAATVTPAGTPTRSPLIQISTVSLIGLRRDSSRCALGRERRGIDLRCPTQDQVGEQVCGPQRDRKSTRLNSSH